MKNAKYFKQTDNGFVQQTAEEHEASVKESKKKVRQSEKQKEEHKKDDIKKQDVQLLKINFEEEVKSHPKLEECKEGDCIICGYRDCPHKDPLHYHHDGCPSCFNEAVEKELQAEQ